MMKNDEVKSYIDEQLQRMHNEKIADATEVMIYLTSVLRGTASAEIVVVEGAGDGYSNAKKILKAPDEKERLKAAELLGKRHGLFKENLKIEGSIPIVITGENELE